MKQQFILWAGAFVITFVFGFLLRNIDPQKPVTGTVQFGSQNVGYKFDRVYRSNDNYKVMIFSELKDLHADLEYKDSNSGKDWTKVPMAYSDKILTASIPKHPAQSLVDYRVILNYSGEAFIIPKSDGLTIRFLGKVSSQIMVWYYLAIFGGLLLSTRIGLEYFNENEKIKKLSFFAFITFFFYAMLLIPVKKTYELSALGKSVPQITALFSLGGILIIVLWIAGIIGFFNYKNRRLLALIVAILTMIIFISFGY